MVLIMLGLFGVIYIQSKNLAAFIKENVKISAYVADDATQQDIDQNIAALKQMPELREVKYIHKDQAAVELSKELGVDIVGFSGYNPLPHTLELNLKSEAVNSETLNALKIKIINLPKISEVNYQELVFDRIGANLKPLSFIFGGLAVLFFIVSVILINNTVRLNLFARRFSIKSMQLVGATHWFIIRPFVTRSIFNGFYGGLLACAVITGFLILMARLINKIELLYDLNRFAILFIVLILAGIVISTLSTLLSTKKYLKTKIEDLY